MTGAGEVGDGGRRAGYTAVMRTLYVIVPLFALLAAAFWFAGASWVHLGSGSDTPEIPLWGWLAIGGGVVFSLLLGAGLMALMFYSSRRGYDEAGDDPHK